VKILVLSVGVWAFVWAIISRMFPSANAETGKVTHLLVANNQVITNDFLGVNAVYHGFSFMKERGFVPMDDLDRKLEFSRVRSMRLKIARTWYRPNWACKSDLYDKFDWESDQMKAFYRWLDQMKALNVKVAIQAGWYFPKDTYYGRTFPDTAKDVNRYSEWVSESLYQMIRVRGYTNIKYLVLFTEPLNNPAKTLPRIAANPEYYGKICRAIDHKLKNTGLRADLKLVGPNSGSTDTAAYVGWSVNNLDKVIDIYSWHAYNGKAPETNPPLEYDGWKQIAEAGKGKIAKTGKPFWIDEYGAFKPDERIRFRPDYGNYLAQCVAAFTNAGAQTSLLWILFDQKYEGRHTSNDSFYEGVHRWGLVRYAHDKVEKPHTPYPAWYAFQLMSKYLGGRNKTKVYRTVSRDSLQLVATRPGKDLSVMVINSAHTRKKFDVRFAVPVSRSFQRFLYDPVGLPALSGREEIKMSKRLKSIADILPARSVAIYTTMN